MRESRTAFVSPVELARVHLALGDRGGALAELERARSARASALPIVATDPCFAPLRRNPRFEAVVPRGSWTTGAEG